MGCYPLGKMMSKALGRHDCKGRRRPKRVVVYSPPPSYHSHGRGRPKVVTFKTDPVDMMPPEPVPTPTVTKHHPVHPDADVLTSAHAETAPNRESAQARVRFGNGPDTHLDPDPDPDTDPHPQPPPPRRAGPPGLSRHEPESRPFYSASAHRYVASPLTRWEEGERRRPEYLSGEYRYYPTPVREGIYSIATDANRLSTIFSEENPNACNIV